VAYQFSALATGYCKTTFLALPHLAYYAVAII